MIRLATPETVVSVTGMLLSGLLIGSFAGRMAKYLGTPIELRILAFLVLAGLTLAIWRVGRRSPETAARGTGRRS